MQTGAKPFGNLSDQEAGDPAEGVERLISRVSRLAGYLAMGATLAAIIVAVQML